jgi:hypothetical protein
MIKDIYLVECRNLVNHGVVNPLNVELCAILERALNYMHSGNTKVIATSIMNPMFIGRALIKDGLPCLNDMMVKFFPSSWEVSGEHMPYDQTTGIPKSAASSVVRYNYNVVVYGVSRQSLYLRPPFVRCRLAGVDKCIDLPPVIS